MRQLMLELSANHINRWNSDLRQDTPNGLLAGRDPYHRRDRGWAIRRDGSICAAKRIKQIVNGRYRRISLLCNCRRQASERLAYAKRLFSDAVETSAVERLLFAKAIVKDARARPNYSFRRFGRISRTRRPRECKAGCKVELTARVVLYFIAQAETESQIRTIAPIVLDVRFNIELADAGQRAARINTELGRASALRANLSSR